MQIQYVKSSTLGRDKPFQWRIGENSDIEIKRDFKNKPGVNLPFAHQELDKLNSYIPKDKWIPLANSVSKLGDGTEKDGVGSFIYKNIKPNETFAQAASQISAIFVLAGVWDYNGRKKDMEFKKKSDDWIGLVNEYYKHLQNRTRG